MITGNKFLNYLNTFVKVNNDGGTFAQEKINSKNIKIEKLEVTTNPQQEKAPATKQQLQDLLNEFQNTSATIDHFVEYAGDDIYKTDKSITVTKRDPDVIYEKEFLLDKEILQIDISIEQNPRYIYLWIFNNEHEEVCSIKEGNTGDFRWKYHIPHANGKYYFRYEIPSPTSSKNVVVNSISLAQKNFERVRVTT